MKINKNDLLKTMFENSWCKSTFWSSVNVLMNIWRCLGSSFWIKSSRILMFTSTSPKRVGMIPESVDWSRSSLSKYMSIFYKVWWKYWTLKNGPFIQIVINSWKCLSTCQYFIGYFLNWLFTVNVFFSTNSYSINGP